MPLTSWEEPSTNINRPFVRAWGSRGEVVVVDFGTPIDLLIDRDFGADEIKARLKMCSEAIRRRAGAKYDWGEVARVDGHEPAVERIGSYSRGDHLRIELTDADARWVLAQVPDDEQGGISR